MATVSIRNAIFFTSASYLSQAAGLLSQLVTRVFVSPAAFGAIAFANSIHQYPRHISGLFLNATVRRVPQLDARGEHEEVQRYISTANAATFLILTVQFLVYLGLAWLMGPGHLRWGFTTLAFITLGAEGANFYRWVLMSRHRVRTVSIIIVVGSILQAVLLIGLGYVYGDVGYYAALSIGAIFAFSLAVTALLKSKVVKFGFVLDWTRTRRIAVTGFPLLLNGILLSAILFMDRLFVQYYLGLEALGFYSLATQAVMLLRSLSTSSIMSLQARYLADKELLPMDVMNERLINIQRGLGAVTVLAGGIMFLMADVLISHLLPAYTHVVEPVHILIIATAVFAASVLPGQIHFGADRMWRANGLMAASIVVAAVVFALAAPNGLVAMAWAVLVVHGVYTATLTASAEYSLKVRGLGLASLFPFLAMAAMYAFYYGFSPLWAAGLYLAVGAYAGLHIRHLLQMRREAAK